MDNRHIPYLNAIIAADIKGKAKFTLVFLIDSMDFDTRETYIGQTALCQKMGVSYDAAADGLDLLEKLNFIKTVGIRPIHPGSNKATTVYRILLEPVGVGNLPTVGDLPKGDLPTVGKLPSNHKQSGFAIEGLCGGGVVDEVKKTPDLICADPGNISTSSRKTKPTPADKPVGFGKTTPKTSSASSGTPSPNPSREVTEPPQPTRYPSDGDPSQESSVAAPPFTPFTEDEINELCLALSRAAHNGGLTGIPCDPHIPGYGDALRAYRGPYNAAQLCMLIWWAFSNSDYWPKAKAWSFGLNMENFLGRAATIDKQFSPWRQRPACEKKFSTLAAGVHVIFGTKPEEAPTSKSTTSKAFDIEDDNETAEAVAEDVRRIVKEFCLGEEG
jgi:hypothetical protein